MKMNSTIKKILLFSLVTLIICSCGPARRTIAIEDGWDLLSERKVNFIRDKDIIDVHNSNKLTAIRFKVEGQEIKLSDLKIYFQNGDKLEPSMDDVIAADQYSREVDLGQEGKFVNKIEFRYHTIGANVLKGRANVLVFGRRYSGY